ncbi:MAG: hypothetical protein L6R30_09590 [Thermoanaerobaculia bacterium]|nr:hypothetical protein [Thermoanaerobaculia bacterium]
MDDDQKDTQPEIPDVRRSGLSPIEAACFDHCYHLGGHFAAAIRLAGAGSEFFAPRNVIVSPTTAPYELPLPLLIQKPAIVARLKEEAARDGTMYFDGPCVRLIDYRASPTDATAATEAKQLSLTLGPVGWYDYSVANQEWAKAHEYASTDRVRDFLDIERVTRHKEISGVRLTNIVVTVVTITTRDGYVLYSLRSKRLGSYHNRLISAVSENLHQVKDRALDAPVPSVLPAPFRAVLRGIREELSAAVANTIPSEKLLLLGLSFHLETFHPSLIFLVPLDLTLAEVKQMRRERPGVDFTEGDLLSVRVDKAEAIDRLLADERWIPCGKASLIRSLEFLRTLAEERGDSVFQVVHDLATLPLPR